MKPARRLATKEEGITGGLAIIHVMRTIARKIHWGKLYNKVSALTRVRSHLIFHFLLSPPHLPRQFFRMCV